MRSRRIPKNRRASKPDEWLPYRDSSTPETLQSRLSLFRRNHHFQRFLPHQTMRQWSDRSTGCDLHILRSSFLGSSFSSGACGDSFGLGLPETSCARDDIQQPPHVRHRMRLVAVVLFKNISGNFVTSENCLQTLQTILQIQIIKFFV